MSEGPPPGASQDRIVFEVEVEADTDPITGFLRADEQEVSFVGWVALAGALERILASGGLHTQK